MLLNCKCRSQKQGQEEFQEGFLEHSQKDIKRSRRMNTEGKNKTLDLTKKEVNPRKKITIDKMFITKPRSKDQYLLAFRVLVLPL